MKSLLWVEAALYICYRSYRSFILNLIFLWVVLNFREGFTLCGGFCILGLRLRSERRLRLNLHSMVLRNVVTLWVESVFILDRNEGFAFFRGYSSWFSCLFSYFSRLGTGPVLLCSRLCPPSFGLITCRMFFTSSFVPLTSSFAGSGTIVVCPAFCCRTLG